MKEKKEKKKAKEESEEEESDIEEDEDEDVKELDNDDESDEESETKEPAVDDKYYLKPGYKCNACGELNAHVIFNCPLRIKKRKTVNEMDSSGAAINYTAYISGIPFNMTKEKLLKYVKDNGCDFDSLKPKDVKFLTDVDDPKKSRGVAFIKFQSNEQIEACLLLHGTSLDNSLGNTLKLAVTRARPESKQKGKESDESSKKQKKERCYRCGEQHKPSECTNERICYRCKSTEHLSTACPFRIGRTKAKEET